jgi:hypothetical protein
VSIFGWSYPPGCSGTPYDDAPDDNVCAWCGASLPENPPPTMWAHDGVCDAKCALHQGLSDLGVAAGMEPPKGITAEYRDKILRALEQVTR